MKILRERVADGGNKKCLSFLSPKKKDSKTYKSIARRPLWLERVQ